MLNSALTTPIFCIFFSCTMLLSCDATHDVDECAEDPAGIKAVVLYVEHLEDELLSVSSTDELKALLDKHPVVKEIFLNRSQFPDEATFLSTIFRKFSNPHIDTLQMEIDRVFGDGARLEKQLSEAFSHIKYYFPEAKIPKIKTVASGLDYDLYISDTLIIIGLDYYLGEGAKYRPIGMYEYMLSRYAPDYIAPSIMLLYGITAPYNQTDISDKTILADMVAYGKSFYFAKRMMPCTPDSIFIWYTGEEMKGVQENADIIWAHFVENEILYETSHMVKTKYIEERPKTFEIGEKAPGRIGTWLGWAIVAQYMRENEEVSLPELMKVRDAVEILKKSRFKP